MISPPTMDDDAEVLIALLYRVEGQPGNEQKLVRARLAPSERQFLTASRLRALLERDGVDLSMYRVRLFDNDFQGYVTVAEDDEPIDVGSLRETSTSRGHTRSARVAELLLEPRNGAMGAAGGPQQLQTTMATLLQAAAGMTPPGANGTSVAFGLPPGAIHMPSITSPTQAPRDTRPDGTSAMRDAQRTASASFTSLASAEAGETVEGMHSGSILDHGGAASHAVTVLAGAPPTATQTGSHRQQQPGALTRESTAYLEVLPFDASALDLALLHASPLVWMQGGRAMPLDNPGNVIDFKSEVKALWEMLGRTEKQVSVRFDVASSSALGEVLATKPVALHLVCHGDFDPNKLRQGLAEEQAFFLGLEDAEGALDLLSLQRLKALLTSSVVRSTRLVFISACYSQLAAEAFVEAGVPHVVAVRRSVKVLDDAAALFARHFYFALVEGHTVRESFEHGAAQLAAAAPTTAMRDPASESAKFILLPAWDAASGDDDPHDLPLFPFLPGGTVIEKNPLPELEPPYVQKPFLGRAIALYRLCLKLGQRRQKEVRLVTLNGPSGVGKSSLAIAAASYLFERRWFPDGCVRVELSGCETEGLALDALSEALDMDLHSLNDIGKALKHWRGLLVLDKCDAAREAEVMPPLLAKLLGTQHTRIVCTCKDPLSVPGELSFRTEPLAKSDAAMLFRQLALEGLPDMLRGKDLNPLIQHPVLGALEGLPGAIWHTAPLLRHGKSMADLEEELKGPVTDEPEPVATGEEETELPSPPPPSPLLAASKSTAAGVGAAPRWPPPLSREASVETATTSPSIETKAGSDARAGDTMDTNAATNDAGAVGGTLVPHEGAGTLDAAQSAMTGGSAQLRFNPQYERFNKSLRRSLEVSLNFLQKTNAHAYALLAVLTMLPGGATKADLDAIWQPQDMVSSTADGNACSWPQLMQVLTQPPSQGASPAGQWLVQKRTRHGASEHESFHVSAREAAKTFSAMPEELAHKYAERCAFHFAELGEELVSLALASEFGAEHCGNDAACDSRTLFLECTEQNMWACLELQRLSVLQRRAEGEARVAKVADATAQVGNALTRVLASLGRRRDAAKAAEQTVAACAMLGAAKSAPAVQALHLLGDMRMQLGQLADAHGALIEALSVLSVSPQKQSLSQSLPAVPITSRHSLPPLSISLRSASPDVNDEIGLVSQASSLTASSVVSAIQQALPRGESPPQSQNATPGTRMAISTEVLPATVADAGQPERCSSGDTDEGRGGNSSSPPESASQQLVSRPSLGSRSHWHFLKWHVKHQNFAAQRETSTLQAGEVDVLLTLGDVHFATATEAATRGDPPEVIEAEFARAEESFEAARRASLEPESASSSTTAPDSSSPSPGATTVRFKTGLAKVALARNRPADCLGHLEELPVSEPFVLQLRGEAHAAMHAYDQARDELAEAARLWRRAGDGMHEQATLQELERVRKRIEAEHVGAGRLIVFHAAPLVESDQAPAASISANDPEPPGVLQPIAFSKRLGLRAWRKMRTSIAALKREIKISLELATLENLSQALQQSDQPMLHFLPARDYTSGISMESFDGELKPLPLAQLKDLLQRCKPRRPSLVFCCARQSLEAGRVFLAAGVPVVVCMRGYLPEDAIGKFVDAFYGKLLTGDTPQQAFEHAQNAQLVEPPISSAGGFVLLAAETSEGPAGNLFAVPECGELRDLSPKLCPSNLPLVLDDDQDHERSRGALGANRGGGSDDGGGPLAKATSTAVGQQEGEAETLAHGAAFVGRHLEIHKIIRSCLHNQLTAVYGDRGSGKSAIILEAASYMRQRNRFPNGIFCCTLEGLRSMKAVRTRLSQTLNIPLRSSGGRDLYELMARYSSCLLILDRCEEAIRQRRTQFIWFIQQLLQQSSVKVVISSLVPLEELSRSGVDSTTWGAIHLAQMRSRDAALLLLESCEREIEPSEVGLDDEGAGGILNAIASHRLLKVIGGMPSAIRWAARRLSDITIPDLLSELDELTPNEVTGAIESYYQGAPELAPSLLQASRRRQPHTQSTTTHPRQRSPIQPPPLPSRSGDHGRAGHPDQQTRLRFRQAMEEARLAVQQVMAAGGSAARAEFSAELRALNARVALLGPQPADDEPSTPPLPARSGSSGHGHSLRRNGSSGRLSKGKKMSWESRHAHELTSLGGLLDHGDASPDDWYGDSGGHY